jgi:hypothetical protein
MGEPGKDGGKRAAFRVAWVDFSAERANASEAW